MRKRKGPGEQAYGPLQPVSSNVCTRIDVLHPLELCAIIQYAGVRQSRVVLVALSRRGYDNVSRLASVEGTMSMVATTWAPV